MVISISPHFNSTVHKSTFNSMQHSEAIIHCVVKNWFKNKHLTDSTGLATPKSVSCNQKSKLHGNLSIQLQMFQLKAIIPCEGRLPTKMDRFLLPGYTESQNAFKVKRWVLNLPYYLIEFYMEVKRTQWSKDFGHGTKCHWKTAITQKTQQKCLRKSFVSVSPP